MLKIQVWQLAIIFHIEKKKTKKKSNTIFVRKRLPQKRRKSCWGHPRQSRSTYLRPISGNIYLFLKKSRLLSGWFGSFTAKKGFYCWGFFSRICIASQFPRNKSSPWKGFLARTCFINRWGTIGRDYIKLPKRNRHKQGPRPSWSA